MSDLCECGLLKEDCTHPNCGDARKKFDARILADGIKDISSKKLQEKEQKGND
jgi:hypothetical protein